MLLRAKVSSTQPVAVSVIGTADIRGAFHMGKAEGHSFFAVVVEFGRFYERGNWKMVAARRKVLADTEIVAAGCADIKESGEYLFC